MKTVNESIKCENVHLVHLASARAHIFHYLPTHLSCVSPAVTPLLEGPVSFLQLLLEAGGLCAGA